MAWRFHDYECACGHVFECLVDNRTFIPKPCPECNAEGAKLLPVGRVNSISTYVPDYPGANIHRAGFANLRRTPDKKGVQVFTGDIPKAAKTDSVPSAPVTTATK